jgi:hypothetical protein
LLKKSKIEHSVTLADWSPELARIIDEFDEDGFVQYVKHNMYDERFYHRFFNNSFLLPFDQVDRVVYKKLVSRCAKRIMAMIRKSDSLPIPYPVSPRLFQLLNLKVPNKLLMEYSPNRAANTIEELDSFPNGPWGLGWDSYEPGAKEIMERVASGTPGLIDTFHLPYSF